VRRGRAAVVVAFLAALLALALPTPATAAATSTRHAVPGGSYLLHIPPGAAVPRPLVVNLHGYAWNGQHQEDSTGMDAHADAHGYAVAYPDGPGGKWAAGRCCVTVAEQARDDVSYLVRVVQDAAVWTPVDPNRVYVVGFSNGGMMAWKALCRRPDVFAAAGSVAGSLVTGCLGTNARVIRVHGTADRTVPYYGGVGFHDVIFPSLTWGIPLQCPTCTIVVRLHSGGHVWPANANDLLWQQLAAWPR
jgi:poly(3-hydroxybutyrate) depolymerase